jgi:HD-GYP domain-containing protein (c-di-GMP phosphodiesterase class II)
LKLAGLLHDVGKIGVQESVLNKPGRLTEEQFELVKLHPEIGEHILSPIVDSTEILDAVRSHHEHYNGRGYPDGLKNDEISLGARILAITDAYEAMTSERPYRASMNADAALNEIEHNKGTQFDPEIADTFTRIEESRVSDSKKKKQGRKSPIPLPGLRNPVSLILRKRNRVGNRLEKVDSSPTPYKIPFSRNPSPYYS